MTADKPGAPLPASPTVRLVLVATGMLQITLGAGLVVGWAGIAGSVLTATRAQGGAGLTLDQTTALYGLAAASNYLSPILLGAILDHRGPRTASFVSNALVALGCFLFGRAVTFRQFGVAISMVAFGGPGVQTSVIHTANLFPSKRYFVMGLVGESITLSLAVLPLMDLLWHSCDLDFETLFYGQAVLVGLSAVTSLCIWPDMPYEDIEVGEETNIGAEEEKLVSSANEETELPLQQQSLVKQLSSGAYIRLSIFFLVTSFYANLYIASVTTELGDTQQFTFQTQHQLASTLSFIDAAAILCAPLSGYLLDSVGFGAAAAVAISLGIGQMILLLMANMGVLDSSFDSPDFPLIMALMIASFVCYAAFRAFLFPYFFAGLSKKLGFRFFGLLSGLSFCASGVCQLAIAPLSALFDGECHHIMDNTFEEYHEETCDQGSWKLLHIIQLVNFVLLFLIPYLDARSDAASKTKTLPRTDTEYGSTSSAAEEEMVGAQVY